MAHALSFALSDEGVVRIHDALICLAKFGEQVSLEARHDRLTLAALNSSKTAYASFCLDKTTFFQNYHYSPSEAQSQRAEAEAEPRFTCQLYNKALLSVFKGRLADNRERGTAVERCEVHVQDEPDNVECRFVVKMICRHGVIKTYKLTFEPVEVIHALFDKQNAKNKWKIESNVLRTFIEYFGAGTELLDIYSEEGRVTLTSYTEKVINDMDILKHPLRTSIAIDTLDFEEFIVEEKLRIGITVKDFKAIVTHAERLKTSVTAMYSYPTRPMQLAYGEHGMLCEFTLVTIGEYRGGSATPAPTNTRSLSRTESEQRRSQQASQQPEPVPSDPSSRQSSVHAQTLKQRATADMPPPVEPASRSFIKDIERQRPLRPTPPPPKASLDPESLFLPADNMEDENVWDERSYEDEQDVLGWNPHANRESFSQSFHSFRQDQETTPENLRAEPEDRDMRVPPTQKLSDIRGMFDED
ncbi:MAG: hypothetical protein HETSPECPRED_003939 [Heterodermia speciosa]|uniref:DNA repair protein rad9 n=1 Tax=Heterodermia speciosa TaxID=116794 RepID=A0A8H3FBM5_9LECA|nr:MAG: hypothetical protein HETSPECPRED_003939 [Heterodermia speciosa]